MFLLRKVLTCNTLYKTTFYMKSIIYAVGLLDLQSNMPQT